LLHASRRSPRNGAQRRLPERHEPANAFGYVLRGERRARDILDGGSEAHLIERGAPIELRTPGRIADFTAVTFAVRQNLQIAQLAIRSDADGVRDEILAAHDFIEEDMPQPTTVARGPPDADGAMRGLRTR